MDLNIIYREKVYSGFDSYRRRSPKHRCALVQIWWQEITIKVLDPNLGKKVEKKIFTILANEALKASQNIKEPLSWLLLTSEKIHSNDDARRIIS